MLIFEVRLPLKKPLVTTLTEIRAFTSRNYEVKKRTECTKIIKKHKLLWSHSSVLLENNSLKNTNFWDLFTSKRTTGSYFQWNVCTRFQKICSCARYEPSKIIQKIQITLVELTHFCFRVIASKCLFSRFLYLQENYWWLQSMKRARLLSQKIESNKVWKFQKYEKNINYFGCTSQILL